MSMVTLTGPQAALGWLAQRRRVGAPAGPLPVHVTSPETQGIANLCPRDKPSDFTGSPHCPGHTQRSPDYFLGARAQNLLPPRGSSEPEFSQRWFRVCEGGLASERA